MPLGDWTATLEAELTNSTDASLTDDEINQTRVLVRERAKVEHDWGSLETGYTDTGRAVPGAARAFFQSTSPTALRRPDNSASQSGGTSTLTGLKDQGRLWIDSDSNELWVYDASGTWARAIALPSTSGASINIAATSADTAAIATGGSTTTLGGWTTALSITLPGTASNIWEVNIIAGISLRNTGASDRYARVDLMQTSPAVATPIICQEAILRQRISASIHGITWLNFGYHSGGLGTQVFTYAFVGEVNTGTDILWGAGATELDGNGAVNTRPWAQMWLRGVVL